MKLTRPRLLLLVALLALTGLLAVVWEPLWLTVAYERQERPHVAAVVYKKRSDWLPGVETWTPPQACPHCYFAENPEHFGRYCESMGIEPDKQLATHARCWYGGDTLVFRRLPAHLAWELNIRLPTPGYDDWPCTCPVCNHRGAK